MSSTTMKINVQSKVTGNSGLKDINEVYENLNQETPNSCYEFYNTNEIEFIKPFIDIDITSYNKINMDDDNVIDKSNKFLSKLFGDDINVIHTTHHRRLMKPGKKTKTYKKSYHFVIENKKIKPSLLKKVMKKYKTDYPIKDEKNKNSLDLSVYRDGDNKFRLPLTIKEPALETPTRKNPEKMSMSIDNTIENFSKYCLTLTENLDEISIKVDMNETVEEKEEKKEEEKKDKHNNSKSFDEKYYKLDKRDYNKVNKLISKYDMIDIKKEALGWIINIKDFDCPFYDHDGTNNRYIHLDFLANKIYLRCHSENCENKRKILMENVFRDLNMFNLSIFIRLFNYKLQKKYLENRVIYLSKSNEYKEIMIDKRNNKYLEDIIFNPIATSTTLIATKDGEKETMFGKIYAADRYRKIYSNTIFNPDKEDENRAYYNEFFGMGYEKILPFDTDYDKVYQKQSSNLHFYEDFLLKYVCNGKVEVLEYFLCLLSFYVKYPQHLNHIILVLYSNEQGTGKSTFYEFLSKIIGKQYCESAEMEQINNTHSNLSYKKIINLIEELTYDGKQSNAKKLKYKCQTETLILNEKCVSMRRIDNFVHYIITTNEYRSLPLEQEDRRHYPLEFTKIYDNPDYINKITKLYANKKFIYAFGYYLKNRTEPFDFTNLNNWITKRPTTDLFKLMINTDSLDKFLINLITCEFIEEKKIDQSVYDNYFREANNEILLRDEKLLIKKLDLYQLYYCSLDADRKKYQKDNFYREVINARKYGKLIEYQEEEYLELDMFKLQKSLRLLEKEIRLPKVLDIRDDEDLPLKIKVKQINLILKNNQ